MGNRKEFKNVGLDTFNNNSMDSIYSGVVETSKAKEPQIKQELKQERKEITNEFIQSSKKLNKIQKANLDNPKVKVGTSKAKNYTITFKIDADIDEYLHNIEWIQYDKGMRGKLNKNVYVNELIRQDMIKTLNLKPNASYDEIKTAWEQFKKDNNY